MECVYFLFQFSQSPNLYLPYRRVQHPSHGSPNIILACSYHKPRFRYVIASHFIAKKEKNININKKF